MIDAIIVDDEVQAIDALTSEIALNCPTLKIVGSAKSVESAVELIQKSSPQLIFLDIQLGSRLGFEVLQKLPNLRFDVIFTTAYSFYALKAIRFSALDYLLKPVSGNELRSAIQKYSRRNNTLLYLKEKINLLEENLRSENNTFRKIALNTNHGVAIFELESILYIQADANYSTVHFVNGKRLTTARSLKKFDESLSSESFLRTHQSYLVNINHVRQYLKSESALLLKGDIRVPISSRKKPIVNQVLSERTL